MEDEEGYMALSFKSRKEHGKHDLPSQSQGTLPKYSCCHKLRVGGGCTMIVLLIGAVVVLATWVFQIAQPTDVLEKASIAKNGTTTGNKSSLENFVSRLRRFLCKPLDNKVTVFQMRQTMDALEKGCRCLGPTNETEKNPTLSCLRQYLCKPLDNSITVFQIAQPTDVLEKGSITQGPPNGTTTGNKSSLENYVSHLRRFLCKPLDNKVTGNSSCHLCPQNWSLHENKCYWVSKERQTWHKGKEDCAAKLSRMLVIQDQEEVTFIQNITEGAQLLWVGLEAKFPERKWIWIDGSPLDDKLFQDLGPAEANCCGRLNGNQIISELCSTIAIWICETNALLI